MDDEHSFDALKHEVRATLEERGILDSVKARLRAEIFQQIEGQEGRPPLSNANLEVNELIREYLEFNGYRNALSVFLTETGQPKQCPFGRSYLVQQLGVTQTPETQRVPLLYSMVGQLREQAPRIARGGVPEESADSSDSLTRPRTDRAPTDSLTRRRSPSPRNYRAPTSSRSRRSEVESSMESEADRELERKRQLALLKVSGISPKAPTPKEVRGVSPGREVQRWQDDESGDQFDESMGSVGVVSEGRGSVPGDSARGPGSDSGRGPGSDSGSGSGSGEEDDYNDDDFHDEEY